MANDIQYWLNAKTYMLVLYCVNKKKHQYLLNLKSA